MGFGGSSMPALPPTPAPPPPPPPAGQPQGTKPNRTSAGPFSTTVIGSSGIAPFLGSTGTIMGPGQLGGTSGGSSLK